MNENMLPIFPLPNVVVFPKILLPLHIFEPRYKHMVEDVIDKDRLIGMILLQDGWQNDYFGTPSVHRVGCMVKIETYEKLPQGRFNILLRGLKRFEIVKFVKDKPYRLALVKYLDDQPFLLENHDQMKARDALLDRLLLYFNQVLGIDLSDERLDRSASLETVVNQVAAILDIPAARKQELLETRALAKRFDLVQGIVEGGLSYAEKLRTVVSMMRYAPTDPNLN